LHRTNNSTKPPDITLLLQPPLICRRNIKHKKESNLRIQCKVNVPAIKFSLRVKKYRRRVSCQMPNTRGFISLPQ